MIRSLDKCSASIQQMRSVNKTLKKYGTPYFLPEENDAACIFACFCDTEECSHHTKEYFKKIVYPHEHHIVNNDITEQERNNIQEATKAVCRYYGLFSSKNGCEDDVNGIIKYMWDGNRTFFSREYDRIICTPAFRHLQYKTQVMVNSASDDQRTRLLHSLEVQKIAKKIALGIGANWELAETIAIAHDIGHAPFGHEGETIIKTFLQHKDSGVFSHAIQSVKVLDELCDHPILKGYNIRGLGLSDYVLEGVLKHDSDTFTDGVLNPEFKKQYDVERLCKIVGIEMNETDDYIGELNSYLIEDGFNNEDVKLPQVLIGSVEAQIVAWADKIAYLGHDWEEFIDTGLLEKMMSRINDMVLDIETIVNEKNGKEINDVEVSNIRIIWEALQKINTLYMIFDESKSEYSYEKWSDVQEQITKLINAIITIERSCTEVSIDSTGEPYRCHKYFTAREYAAFKNYFKLTASWVDLLEVYPRTYGMKNDPIYVFYQYLTKIRSTIITPNVTEKIIERTNDYVKEIDPTDSMTRKDYLIHCNKLWVYKYASVCRNSFEDPKKIRGTLKKTLRTCFLVGFHDTPVRFEKEEIIGMKDSSLSLIGNETSSEDNNKHKYTSLLNIFDFISDEFIRSTRVKFMKHTAQEIINTLLDYYYEHPDMLPFVYRKLYNNIQYDLAVRENIPEITEEKHSRHACVCKARVVADYVANMTDRMAKLKYDEIKSSDSKWSNAYETSLT